MLVLKAWRARFPIDVAVTHAYKRSTTGGGLVRRRFRLTGVALGGLVRDLTPVLY